MTVLLNEIIDVMNNFGHYYPIFVKNFKAQTDKIYSQNVDSGFSQSGAIMG